MAFPIRSPRATLGGIVVFPRVIDKIRLRAAGTLPPGYNVGVIPGKRTFDDRLCRFLGISFDDLEAKVLSGASDDEILAWAFATGTRPDEEKIEVWNAFLSKRGWRDAAAAGLARQKEEAGLAHRDDLLTFFDLMDAEEGH